MSASLVGSEMCIRDRGAAASCPLPPLSPVAPPLPLRRPAASDAGAAQARARARGRPGQLLHLLVGPAELPGAVGRRARAAGDGKSLGATLWGPNAGFPEGAQAQKEAPQAR
eukprot:1601971-Alexandrium_andersonii.AAC.1